MSSDEVEIDQSDMLVIIKCSEDLIRQSFLLTYLSYARFWSLVVLAGMQTTVPKHVDTVDINRVDIGTIICQHGCQRPSHNFASIDDSYSFAF
jgi:hypothetical protein